MALDRYLVGTAVLIVVALVAGANSVAVVNMSATTTSISVKIGANLVQIPHRVTQNLSLLRDDAIAWAREAKLQIGDADVDALVELMQKQVAAQLASPPAPQGQEQATAAAEEMMALNFSVGDVNFSLPYDPTMAPNSPLVDAVVTRFVEENNLDRKFVSELSRSLRDLLRAGQVATHGAVSASVVASTAPATDANAKVLFAETLTISVGDSQRETKELVFYVGDTPAIAAARFFKTVSLDEQNQAQVIQLLERRLARSAGGIETIDDDDDDDDTPTSLKGTTETVAANKAPSPTKSDVPASTANSVDSSEDANPVLFTLPVTLYDGTVKLWKVRKNDDWRQSATAFVSEVGSHSEDTINYLVETAELEFATAKKASVSEETPSSFSDVGTPIKYLFSMNIVGSDPNDKTPLKWDVYSGVAIEDSARSFLKSHGLDFSDSAVQTLTMAAAKERRRRSAGILDASSGVAGRARTTSKSAGDAEPLWKGITTPGGLAIVTAYVVCITVLLASLTLREDSRVLSDSELIAMDRRRGTRGTVGGAVNKRK